MKKIALIACCLLVCLLATNAIAANQVTVQSRAFAAGQTACTVGVFIDNDVPLTGLVLPLEIRTHSGTAFYLGNLIATTWNFTLTGRLKNSPLGDVADPGGLWPAGNVTRRQLADPVHVDSPQVCSGPISSSWAVSAARGDTISPDGFLLATVSSGDPNIGEEITLPVGSDGATPSMRFLINLIPGQNGCMKIDTCCVTPANHLVYVDDNSSPVFPAFTAGLLTVGTGNCADVPVNQPPTAICQNVQVAANGSCQGTATAAQVNNGSNDAEDGTNLILSLTPAGPYALGANPVSLIVTDQGGLADTCAATITVVDTTKPVVTCDTDITVSNDPGQCGAIVNYNYGVSDACGPTTLVEGPASGALFPIGSTLVRIIGLDNAGNRDTCEFHVTVNDTTKPSISCPGPISVQCHDDIPNVLDSAGFIAAGGSLADNCPNYHFSYLGTTSNGQSCPEVLTRRYVITDAAGNADTCEQTVTVDDTTAPQNVTCVNDTVVTVPFGTPSVVVNYSGGSLFTDNCDQNLTITFIPPSGSSFTADQITNVLIIASDDCGNTDTCNFNVDVQVAPAENLPPVAQCQAIVIEADGNCQGNAVAADVDSLSFDPDGSIQSMVLHPAGPYPLGVNGVWLVVTDNDGAVDSCNTTITVEDNTAPTVTCPDTIVVACVTERPARITNVADFLAAGGTISDNCPGPFSLNFTGQSSSGDAGNGEYNYSYLIFDASGNEQGCTQVILIRDTIAPSVTCPNNVLVQVPFGTPSATVNYGAASATDNCYLSVSISYSQASGTLFPVGQTQVEVIATDGYGNADTCYFTITVDELPSEKVPPVAICTDVTISAAPGKTVGCSADASIDNGSYDPDGGSVSVQQIPPGPYPLGITNVTLIVTDDEGDQASCDATVTVEDNTPPVLTCPSDVKVGNAPAECGAPVFYDPASATDDCDDVVDITYSIPSGSYFTVGSTQIEVIATDESGNADTCYFTVEVIDVEPPTAWCPGDQEIPNEPGQCGTTFNYLFNTVGSTDNCGVESSVYTPQPGSFFPIGTTQVKHVVTDAAGNADSCYFNVTVIDTQGPQLTCPADIEVFAPFGQSEAVVNYAEPTATDNCPGLTTRCHPPSGSAFPIGQTVVTCTTFDASNYYAICQFIITVNEGSQEAPGPHVAVDTLIFKTSCGCDTQYVNVYCVPFPTKGDEEDCWYLASTSVAGVSVSPNPEWAPRQVAIVACGTDLAPSTYQGWLYFNDAPGLKTDSVYIIHEVNFVPPGIAVSPDTIEFTYTGDIFNDKLCLPAQINSTGCGEVCWQLVGPSGDWVWVDPTSGSTPDEVEICVTPCSLQAGVYYQTVNFCVCPPKGDEEPIPVAPCDQLVIKLNVVDPPVLVVEPTELHFELKCDQKALPLPVYIENGGGGVLDWNAWTLANWFTIEPADGTAPDTFWVSVNLDSIKCPEVCDTLIDSICVYGNKGCALNSPQWVTVELVICPPDTTVCDSVCGWVYDCSCYDKSICGVMGAHVELWDSYPDGQILDTLTSEFGGFCFDVEPGVEYDIRVWKKGYCTDVIEDWSCEDGWLSFCLNPLDFVPLPNWPYFTDYYSTNAQFVSGGLPWPIIPGDVIYATDPQGVICGIYWVEADGTYLIHVLGDDPKTLEDEGALPGDSVTLWLNCECPVVAPDTWVNFGNFQFDALWDCENVPLCCDLCVGWNMWSYNRVLPDVTREAVLATIDLNYDAVRSGLCDYGSISWFEGRPVNDLVNVGPSFGYDIHMTADDTVCVEGELIDPTTPIYLCQGWNYIPYWPNEINNRVDALESLAGNYTFIFTMYCDYGVASWSQYREDNQLPNDLYCMEPCHGYWINMKSEDTLIYPAEISGCHGLAKVGSSSSASRVTATPMVADYYGRTSLNSGSVISVRNTAGTLIGETYVDASGAFLIHVYGDVPYTPEVEGAVHGEPLTFEVNGMAASAGREIFWSDRDDMQIELTVDAAAAVPTEYSLLQNYPNPFNAGTVIPFVMKDASQWTLTVYNIMGQTVQTFEGFDAAGTVRVDWNGLDRNGASVPSGVYFYRVTTPEWSATKKMTLLK